MSLNSEQMLPARVRKMRQMEDLLNVEDIILAEIERIIDEMYGAAVFPVMTHLVFGDAFATAFSVLIAALVLFAHRENIKRLLNGTENKFRFHVNAPKSEGEA